MTAQILSFIGAVIGHLMFIVFIQSAVWDSITWKHTNRWVDAVAYSILYVVYIDWLHLEWLIVGAIFN